MRWSGVVAALCAARALLCAQAQAEFERVIAETQERVFPGVVFVKPIQESFDEGEKRKVIVYGSGVIISEDGLVVTNHHVSEKAIEIRCVLSDRREVPAAILGHDKETDLALLKLALRPGEKSPWVPLGDSEGLREGQFVMAMGAPFGFVRSVSLGIVSNTRRYLSASPYNLWIQTDAAINPGNSGGPLVNVRGEVVGINARGVFLADNIGFAIPVNRVKEVIDAIVRHGHVPRSWTGVQLQPLRDFEKSIFIPAERGVMIAGVDRRSPAEQAGLKTGDRILRIDGAEVSGMYMEDLPALRRLLAALPPGRAAEIAYVRGGKEAAAALVPVAKGKIEGDDLELKEWDLTLKEINRHTDRFLAYFQPEGVFIQGVKEGGNAAASGLRYNDILQRIDGEDIPDLAAALRVYQRASTLSQGKRMVLCEVLRGGYTQWAVLDFNRQSQEGAAKAGAKGSF
ncbi:MAG TPA: peptidase [Planctomycetes bacterium]|nr:peptidase [Planctomycetota bacterium]